MFLYQFAIWIFIFLIPDIHGESKETRSSVIIDQDEIAKYYTETKIIGEGLDEEKCSENVLRWRQESRDRISVGVTPTVGLGAALLIFIGVGVFAVAIAQAFQLVRKHVYHDADNLDTAFDAGGKVSIGLTATTIVSQWTWSATLLQSSTVASKVCIIVSELFLKCFSLVRNQWTILVRRRSHDPDHHLLHPLHHVEDESSWCQDIPPGDQGQVRQEDSSCVLHLCFPHQPDRDDVTDYCRHSCAQQVITS